MNSRKGPQVLLVALPLYFDVILLIWVATRQNQQSGMCAQRRLRSALASAQSDQNIRCPHKETLGPKLPTERTAKTLIRLGGCPGWSESLLSALSFCWFCHEAAHLCSISFDLDSLLCVALCLMIFKVSGAQRNYCYLTTFEQWNIS